MFHVEHSAHCSALGLPVPGGDIPHQKQRPMFHVEHRPLRHIKRVLPIAYCLLPVMTTLPLPPIDTGSVQVNGPATACQPGISPVVVRTASRPPGRIKGTAARRASSILSTARRVTQSNCCPSVSARSA